MEENELSRLETRLNSTFPDCVKSSVQVTISAFHPESNQVAGTKKIKAVTIFHPHQHFKHIGFVIPSFGIEFIEIPNFIGTYQKDLEFDKMKFQFEDKTQPGHIATHNDFVFTKKVYVFTDKIQEGMEPEKMIALFKEHGLFLEIRDDEYHKRHISGNTPDVFICHDSRDKDFAEKLAFDLGNSLVKVWYDAYSLEIGDSLTSKIQDGISKAKFGIIVISKNFLSNEKWVKFELQSLMTKQIVTTQKVILPIWHGISADDLKEYYWLLDKVALNSDIGIKGIAFKIKTLVDKYDKQAKNEKPNS
jgi:hypothetical protein